MQRPTARGRLIVVGAGVTGLSAAWWAARADFSVDCFEAAEIGAETSSSAGLAKIFRYAYDDPFYVELMGETDRRWHELEKFTGQRLIERHGGFYFGAEDAASVRAVQDSLSAYGRPFDILRPDDDRLACSGVRLLDGEIGVFEPAAGVMRPHTVLSVLSKAAREMEVRLHQHVAVQEITRRASGLRVATTAGDFLADRVIVAAGPWAEQLLPELASQVTVTRQYQTVFRSDRPVANGMVSGWSDIDTDDLYGIWNVESGRHLIGGHLAGERSDPDQPVDQRAMAEATESHLDYLRSRLPSDVSLKASSVRVCHYTSTADEDFLVADSRDLPGVVALSACSGHGFKFAITTGHHAVELALGNAVPERFAMRHRSTLIE